MSGLDGNEVIDCHQIALGPNNLYICNAGSNTLDILDPFTYEKKSTLYFGKGGAPGGLLCNSIHVDEDDVYLLFHNRGVVQSFVQYYTHQGDDLIFHWRMPIDSMGAHNIVHWNGRLYYNSSDDGATHCLRPADFDTEDWDKKGKVQIQRFSFRPGWHTKGMAVLDDILIVGLSESGELNHRFISESHIALASLSDMSNAVGNKLIHPINGFIGNINEIRVV